MCVIYIYCFKLLNLAVHGHISMHNALWRPYIIYTNLLHSTSMLYIEQKILIKYRLLSRFRQVKVLHFLCSDSSFQLPFPHKPVPHRAPQEFLSSVFFSSFVPFVLKLKLSLEPRETDCKCTQHARQLISTSHMTHFSQLSGFTCSSDRVIPHAVAMATKSLWLYVPVNIALPVTQMHVLQ